MLKRNRNHKYEVDLRTVDAVLIGGQWATVEIGSFTVGRPVFGIPDPDLTTGVAYSYGNNEDYHPMSYFFTDTRGRACTGPLHLVQQMTYRPAEPDN